MQTIQVSAEWAPRDGYEPSRFEVDNNWAMDGNQVWRRPTWTLAEQPVPEIRAPDEILVKIRSCGVCGSDLHMYETDAAGYMQLAFRTRLPRVLGHEFSGEVVEVGSGVTRFAPGDAITSEEVNYCGDCAACRVGLFNQCVNAFDIGFTIDGAFAEYIVLREKFCWPLNGLREIYSDEKVYEIGALVEPTSVAYEALFTRTGGFRPGGHVAIFGCGPIGLAGVQLARAAGAGRLIAIDVQRERLEMAAQCGADVVLDPAAVSAAGSTVAAEILAATRRQGVALALEASGVQTAVLPEIEQCLDFGGKVSVVGIAPGAGPVGFGHYMMKAGALYASLGHCGGDFGNVISLHESRRIDMASIVTARFALGDGMAGIEKALERTDAKIMIKPA